MNNCFPQREEKSTCFASANEYKQAGEEKYILVIQSFQDGSYFYLSQKDTPQSPRQSNKCRRYANKVGDEKGNYEYSQNSQTSLYRPGIFHSLLQFLFYPLEKIFIIGYIASVAIGQLWQLFVYVDFLFLFFNE